MRLSPWPKVLGETTSVEGNRHTRRAASTLTRCNTLEKTARKRRHLARGTGYATTSHPTKRRGPYRTTKENARRLKLTMRYENMIYALGQRLGIWEVPDRGPGSCRSIFKRRMKR